MVRLLSRVLAAGLVAVMAALGVASVAIAHAELISSSPAANAVLVSGPPHVELTFSERIDPATTFVDLLDASQRSVDGIGDVEVSAGGVTATAPLPDLDPGVYTVSYQVVSAVDGHATTGILAFLVDPDGTGAAPSTPPTSTTPAVEPAAVVARWIGLASALVAFGSLVMWATAGRRGWREATGGDRQSLPPPWALVGAAALATVGGMSAYLVISARPIVDTVGLQGGLPFDPAAPFGWTPFAVAMRVTLLTSLALAALALWSARGSGRAAAVVGVALASAALAGMSLAGHVSASGGPALAMIDLIHLLAVGAWLGGLPAAVLLSRRGRDSGIPTRRLATAILRAHGPLAIVAAPIVALTGIANAPLVLGSARDLAASSYGNLVLAKAGLLAVAVGIGAVNHIVLRRHRVPLVGLVAVELVVAALAVFTAATMVTVPPAASRQAVLVTAPVTPAHLFGAVGPSSVHLTVNLPAPGPQGYQASLVDRETGAPREDVQRVFLDFTPPVDSGLPGTQRVELIPGRVAGGYAASGAYTPVEGDWELDLVIRRRGALDETLSFLVPVAAPPEPEVVLPPSTGLEVPGPIALLWPILPDGVLAWLPVIGGLGALLLLGRSRLPSVVRWGLGGALVGLVLLGGAAAGTRAVVDVANAPPSDLEPIEAPADPEAVERGARLYLANCSACHGREGDGDGPIRTLPPAGPLQDAVRSMTPAELGYRIANGMAGTPMPAFAATLSESDRLDLIGYLRSRWPGD